MHSKPVIFRFTVDTWQHLYSLQHAVQRAENLPANRLVIKGSIRNDTRFDRRDIPIQLTFSQLATPQYKHTSDKQIIFGQLLRNDSLSADIPVDPQVFAELKKNLVEYIGIDGIHIVFTIGLMLFAHDWPEKTAADIVQIDYAMKGDGG